MSTTDQNFSLPSAGQADWDSDLNGNFTIISRGYHTLATAGVDIATGQIVTVNSDGLARLFDPNSLTNQPHLFAYKAVNSGEQDTFLLQGMVRSLAIASPAIPGHTLFASATGSAYVVTSYSAADRPVGIATYEDGFFFSPGRAIFPEFLTDSAEVSAVTGSSHLFQLDGGAGGFVRHLTAIGNSADLVEVQLWSNSARTSPLYETISGGVSVVGSFRDQAGFPFWNTDASTISGAIYGTLQVLSASTVGSDTIGLSVGFERFR